MDPVGVFESGARASRNKFLARGGSFPLALLEERDEVAKLVGSSLMGKRIERPLLSRGDTDSNLGKDLGAYGLAFPHLKPTAALRSERGGDEPVRVWRRRVVAAVVLLRDACLRGACKVQAPESWLRGAALGARASVVELDVLLWQRSSGFSDFFFVAILLLLSIEPTTPVPSRVASQWRERPSSYNGDHNSSEMAGAPPVGRRARTTRTTPSKYVRTTLLCGAHSSSRILVPPVGCWARTTQRTPSEYVRTTLLFGAHFSPRLLVASAPRQLAI